MTQIQINIELSEADPLSTHKVVIKLDDQTLGFVQKINFEADHSDPLSKLNMTFPLPSILSSTSKIKLEEQLDMLKSLKGINIDFVK